MLCHFEAFTDSMLELLGDFKGGHVFGSTVTFHPFLGSVPDAGFVTDIE